VADMYLQPQNISLKAQGRLYVPHVYANERSDGTWEAWIEFHPVDGGPARVTTRETTQPNRTAVEYWVSGLETIYYEGAFQRSVELPVPAR
jgi:hypothetical protein